MHCFRFVRLFLLACVVGVLSACANLQPVREFAATSSQLTAYTEVTQRYLSSSQRVLAQIPDDVAFDVERSRVKDEQRQIAAAKDSLLKLHDTAAGYMGALAQLAGDGAFDLTPQIDKVSGALQAAPSLGLNAEHVSAFASIAAQVVSWAAAAKQNKEVKTMVNAHGAAMDKLLEGMEIVSLAMKTHLDNERGLLNSFEADRRANFIDPASTEPALRLTAEQLKALNKDQRLSYKRRHALLAWAARSYAVVDADETRAVEAAIVSTEAVRAVRQGHNDMRTNINNLSREDVVQLLKKTTAQLRALRANLNKL